MKQPNAAKGVGLSPPKLKLTSKEMPVVFALATLMSPNTYGLDMAKLCCQLEAHQLLSIHASNAAKFLRRVWMYSVPPKKQLQRHWWHKQDASANIEFLRRVWLGACAHCHENLGSHQRGIWQSQSHFVGSCKGHRYSITKPPSAALPLRRVGI